MNTQMLTQEWTIQQGQHTNMHTHMHVHVHECTHRHPHMPTQDTKLSAA